MKTFGKVMAVVLVGFILLGVMLVSSFIGTYNGHNTADNHAEEALGNLDADLQRRNDLVPQLVATVKGIAKSEKEIYTQVAEARASAGKVTIQAAAVDPEKMKQFAAAQGELSSVLTRLMAVQEAYPELKQNENFLTLQDQLEGTENRINVTRKRYNEAVAGPNGINTRLGSFWGGIVNAIAGNKWKKRERFEASEAAHTAPTVSFD